MKEDCMKGQLLIRNARILQGEALVAGDLMIENGRIASIHLPGEGPQVPNTLDAKGSMLLPGFIDVHTHGAVGVDANAARKEDMIRLSAFNASQGATAYLTSVLTDTPSQTERALKAVAAARPEAKNLLGVHLEGPFLSVAYKGAMPESLLRPADPDLLRHYCDLVPGLVRYVTVAPEVPGVAEMIADAPEGLVFAIGHSGASYEQTMEVIKSGAMACTHTFNAMKLFHQHEPGIMGATLESDIYCEAICDGRHLHPGSLRMLIKCKGWDRVVAVSDSIMAAGLPDGQYKLGVNDVTVLEGDAKLTGTNVRAGSTLTPLQGFKKALEFTGASIGQVSRLFCENPARLMGLESKGRIAPGMDADLLLLTEGLDLKATIAGGHIIYQEGVL